jgi:hypothetical protein
MYLSYSRRARCQTGGKLPFNGNQVGATRSRPALSRAPNRVRKMRISAKAWNDVPVQVRNGIAQAREIDLVRMQAPAQRVLHLAYDAHEMRALSSREIRHFRDVRVPHRTAITRIIRLIHENYATPRVAPHQLAAVTRAQFAAHDCCRPVCLPNVNPAAACNNDEPFPTARRRHFGDDGQNASNSARLAGCARPPPW